MEQLENRLKMTENPSTPDINKLLEMHENSKLTQTDVNRWLKTLPEEKRDKARGELENGLMDEIENLPN